MSELRMHRMPEYLTALQNNRFSESMRQAGYHDEAVHLRKGALLLAWLSLLIVGDTFLSHRVPAND